MSTSYYFDESVFSAGGVLLDRANRKVFLIQKQASGEWLLPKGHIEGNETIEDAAKREIFEETGYQNTIQNLLSIQVRPDVANTSNMKIIFWFLSDLADEPKVEHTQMANENFSGQWFGFDEATHHLTWDEDKRLISKIAVIVS